MNYADEVMRFFKQASSPLNPFRSQQKIARAMAPAIAHMGSTDIGSLRNLMGSAFASTQRLRGVLAGERGATQRQRIAGEYNRQLENMRNISDQVLQKLRNKGLIDREYAAGDAQKSIMKAADRLDFNRNYSSSPGIPSRDLGGQIIWEQILNPDGSVTDLRERQNTSTARPVPQKDEEDDFQYLFDLWQ